MRQEHNKHIKATGVALLLGLVFANPIAAAGNNSAAFAKDDRPASDYEQHEIR